MWWNQFSGAWPYWAMLMPSSCSIDVTVMMESTGDEEMAKACAGIPLPESGMDLFWAAVHGRAGEERRGQEDL